MKKVTDQGFTLIELLVTLTVLTVVALSLASFTANWLQASSLAQAKSALLDNAQNALDSVNTDIQLSGASDANNRWPDVNAPNAPSDQLSWQSNAQTLILAKASVDKDNNIIFSDPSKYISQKDNEIYYVSSGTLYRRTLAADDPDTAAITTCPASAVTATCPADKVVATGVSSFLVQYYSADNSQVDPSSARSIQLSLTLKSVSYNHPITASYTTRMVFRNK